MKGHQIYYQLGISPLGHHCHHCPQFRPLGGQATPSTTDKQPKTQNISSLAEGQYHKNRLLY